MWGFLLGKMIEKSIIRVNSTACLQIRFAHSFCQQCLDVCPNNAISIGETKVEVDPKKCDQCNLCTHSCPTETFYQEDELLSAYEQEIEGKEFVCFTCQKQGDTSDILVPCLKVISPEWIMMTVLKDIPVQLYWEEHKCRECIIDWNANELLEWVNEWNDYTPFKVEVIHQKALKRSKLKTISRRDFFSATKTHWRERVGTLIFDSFKESTFKDKVSPQQKREVLKQFASHHSYKSLKITRGVLSQLQLAHLAVDQHCNLCGKCVAICPTNALSIKGNEELTEKWLQFDLLQCIHCGICTKHCGELKLMEASDLNYGQMNQKYSLIKKVQDHCPTCGEIKNRDQHLCQECEMIKEKRAGLLANL